MNSLDAEATEISISVDVGNLTLQVRDNGHGISPSDLALLGDRGATSKLRSAGVPSMYGFRGEAIHSIAAVSLVEISSMCQGSHSGAYTVVLHLGRRLSVGAALEARGRGTSVTLREVFSNRAVARKRLQRPGAADAECEAMREAIGRLAVAWPSVAFRLHDRVRDCTILRTTRGASSLTTFRQLEGRGTLPVMAQVLYGDGEMEAEGHVAIPPCGYHTRELQLLYLNRRPLSRRNELHKLIDAACARIAEATQPSKRAVTTSWHPAYLFFLRCDPSRCHFFLKEGDVEPEHRSCRFDIVWGDGETCVLEFLLGALSHVFASHCVQLEPEEIKRMLAPLLSTMRRSKSRASGSAKRAATADKLARQGADINDDDDDSSYGGQLRSGAQKRQRVGMEASFLQATLEVCASSSSSVTARDGDDVLKRKLIQRDQLDLEDANAAHSTSLIGNEPASLPTCLERDLLGRHVEMDALLRTRQRRPFRTGSRRHNLRRGGSAFTSAQGSSRPTTSVEDMMAGGACVVSKSGLLRMRALGQMERKFIAVLLDDTLLAIDQHAADERVQFELLQRKTFDSSGCPLKGAIERNRLKPARALTVPNVKQFRLETAPRLEGVLIEDHGMLEYLKALQRVGGCSTQPPPAVMRILASKACRRAIMFGDTISLERCQDILNNLAECDLPFQCAHGRPTIAPLMRMGALKDCCYDSCDNIEL
ncbi:MAG: hypothetical protein SGPRY_000001 [Prymnesium sp.]